MRPEFQKMLDHIEAGNPPAPGAGIFGLSIPPEDAALVLIPVPWEATTSYGQGTAQAPQALVQASYQMDLFDLTYGKPFRRGITMLGEEGWVRELNRSARQSAEEVIAAFEAGKAAPKDHLSSVNQASEKINRWVWETSRHHLSQGKLVAVVGGDHSSPFGLMQALGEKYPEGYGILHFDAHHDLRDAYEGFEFSHASIMFNALRKIPQVKKLLSIGIRDFSRDEYELAKYSQGRVQTLYAEELFKQLAQGLSYERILDQAIEGLPQNVYVSFDIDAFEPNLCPSTGTPVPGGLNFYQATYALERLVAAGRKVIGFDLCEVAPSEQAGDEWDANVGARVLYKLCGMALQEVRR